MRGLESGRRAALLVSEVQDGITDPAYDDTPLACQVMARGIVGKINGLAAAFRSAGLPVVSCAIAAPHQDWSHFTVNCSLAASPRRDGRLVDGTGCAALAGHDAPAAARDHLRQHVDRRVAGRCGPAT